MRVGAPSVNPKGRPRVRDSLPDAIRRRVSPEAIVSLALRIVQSERVPAAVRLDALELLAKRGYGAITKVAAAARADAWSYSV